MFSDDPPDSLPYVGAAAFAKERAGVALSIAECDALAEWRRLVSKEATP